jgi:Transposase DDE domain group 1
MQMRLFADGLSTDEMMGNHLRLYFSVLAHTLIEALRCLGLKGTIRAEAQVDKIRLKLFKISAIVRISARPVPLPPILERPVHPRLPRPTLLNSAHPTKKPYFHQ